MQEEAECSYYSVLDAQNERAMNLSSLNADEEQNSENHALCKDLFFFFGFIGGMTSAR